MYSNRMRASPTRHMTLCSMQLAQAQHKLEDPLAKFHQNLLQNAPSQKNSRGSMPPNPHCKHVALPRGMHIAQAQNKLNHPLLANPAQCTCSFSPEHKK